MTTLGGKENRNNKKERNYNSDEDVSNDK